MITPGDSEQNKGELSPTPQPPEAALKEVLSDLAKEPTQENFASVQALLDEKLVAAQSDISAFRFVGAYLQEKFMDAGIRRIERRDYGGKHLKSPYDYTVTFERIDPAKPQPLRTKIARFILRTPLPEPQRSMHTRTASVLDDFSPLRVELPENWNDLASRYIELPNHHVMRLGYGSNHGDSSEKVSSHETLDEWETLKEAKVKLALRFRAQDTGGSTDLNYWGYQPAIDEQVRIVEELHKKMGLTYENGFLVQEPQ